MADKSPSWPLQLLAISLSLFFAWRHPITVDASDDSRVLLNFKATLSAAAGDATLATWVDGKGPCVGGNVSIWSGILCEEGKVAMVRLENMSLSGALNIDILTGLPGLRYISFINNSLEGAIPDFTKLSSLKAIYLSMNRFSGEIPDGMFASMRGLKKLWLSWNNFSGRIPRSLTVPERLMEVGLDGNKFEGQIPDLWQPELQRVNVSHNNLEGPVPEGLSKMSASLFEGNKNLCGPPLDNLCEQPSKKKPAPGLLVVTILIALAVLLLLLLALIIFLLRRRRQREEDRVDQLQSSKSKKFEDLEAARVEIGAVSVEQQYGGGKKVPKKEQGKLTFAREERRTFDLPDLLAASAEVLGSGNFGSSFKATLIDGPAVVVKRFKEMNGVGREDFQEHMRRLGRLSHPNLLPLVAYYYRKEEKLLITDYIPNGSLAHMLHGNVSPLDWPARLKIVKGIARGLAYLYEELPVLAVPHGHLKSSNVLLDASFEPMLTDYALVPVMKKATAAQVMVVYKAPECAQHSQPSKKSDVWSFGILILEILTGKFPANHLTQGSAGADFAGWVNSVVREEKTGEVFDKDMKATKNSEGEMLKLLQIGLACCETDVENRWELSVAVEKIEELKESVSDVEKSSIASEVEGFSSKVMTENGISSSR